jgi:hypothetical protein
MSCYDCKIVKSKVIMLTIGGIVPKRKMRAGRADTFSYWKDMEGQ